jgi:hypothetical protein
MASCFSHPSLPPVIRPKKELCHEQMNVIRYQFPTKNLYAKLLHTFTLPIRPPLLGSLWQFAPCAAHNR